MPVAAAPDVGALAVIVASFAAILVLLGARNLTQLIGGLLRFLPYVGGWVADHILDHVADAISWSIGALWQGIGALAGFIWRPIAWYMSHMRAVAEAIEGAVGWATHTAIDVIPRVTLSISGWVIGQIGAAVNAVTVQLHALASYVDGRFSQFGNWVQGQITGAVVAMVHDLQSVAATLTAEVRDLGSWAEARFAAAFAYVDARVAAAVAWAGAEIGALRAWTVSEFAAVRSWVGGEIATVERDITIAVDGAETLARTLAADAEAAGIAAAGVVAADLEQYLARCGRNLCGGLNNLSTLLQDLDSLFDDGLLIALVVAVATEGPALAREIVDLVQPLVDDTASALRAATGIAA